MKIKCANCGKITTKSTGHYNRAKKLGAKLFCSHKCAIDSRKLTVKQKKEIKRLYDIEYRNKNEKRLKKKRKSWFDKDYAANPEKYREIRRRKQKKHNEYCRQPKYKEYKKEYDKQYRAKKLYGEYFESAIALHQLADIVDNRRAKRDQQIFNKSQKRKRNASKNIKRKELESSSMGFYRTS